MIIIQSEGDKEKTNDAASVARPLISRQLRKQGALLNVLSQEKCVLIMSLRLNT